MRLSLLLLLLTSCSSQTEDNPSPEDFPGTGTFQVEIVPPNSKDPGQAAILGRVLDGVNPSNVIWEVAATEGDCVLLTPRIPFCDPKCSSSEACVEDDECQPYPTGIDIGTVTVEGIKTTAGETDFTMDPVAGYYQPAADIDLAYPPFAEGDAIVFSASGNEEVVPFTMTAQGIVPFEIITESITLEDGKSVEIEWVPGGLPDLAVINLSVNISYHAGTKGTISCETPDSGAIELPSTMVDALKDLGLSGWPMIVFSRTITGTTEPELPVDLIIESSMTQNVNIPGLISCNTDADCPEDQTCQLDFRCE